MLYSVTGAFAEFEREIISQRTKAGLRAALARGRKGGRPKALDADDITKARAMLRDPTISVAAIARHLIEASRVEYNESRPHMALGNIPPSEYALRAASSTT